MGLRFDAPFLSFLVFGRPSCFLYSGGRHPSVDLRSFFMGEEVRSPAPAGFTSFLRNRNSCLLARGLLLEGTGARENVNGVVVVLCASEFEQGSLFRAQGNDRGPRPRPCRRVIDGEFREAANF